MFCSVAAWRSFRERERTTSGLNGSCHLMCEAAPTRSCVSRGHHRDLQGGSGK
jgi:hypothetical protein